MSRLQSIGNLLQAAVFGGLLAWLAPRWLPAAVLAGLLVAIQILAAGLVLVGRARALRWTAGASVLLGALLLGLHVQAAVHAATAYGSDATRHGQLALGAILLATPWVLGWPAWQWLHGRPPGRPSVRGLGLLLAAGGLAASPGVARALSSAPTQEFPPQAQLAQAAEAALDRWMGADTALPTGAGPATVLLTPWSEGRPGATVSGTGDSLDQALSQALDRLEPPGPRPALVVDLARQIWAPGSLHPAGSGGFLGHGDGHSPASLVRDGGVALVELLPGWGLPVAEPPGDGQDLAPARFDSVVASSEGVHTLHSGWVQGPTLSADAALASAIAAGDYLVSHQAADGRYAYIVKGPSGRMGEGYNYPRHAGVTWFLARLARRTGEPRFSRAAAAGLAFLERETITSPDGQRAWVRDPRRKDGLAWAGTTALAALAASAFEGEVEAAPAWGRLLASVVDEAGAVRGEFDVETGAVRQPQPMNPYGQGQVSLALAALVRDGHEDLRPATRRAGAFLDGGYAPLAAGRLVVLDEHWTCIAALALDEVLGKPHGLGVCRGYMAQSASRVPAPGSALNIAAGPGGGLAEAVVAAAMLEPASPNRDRALAFGQYFLDAQYRAEDAPLLPSRALLGAWRDRPWDLDVQMDAVQHIGCAMLGIEELLRGERLAGARP